MYRVCTAGIVYNHGGLECFDAYPLTGLPLVALCTQGSGCYLLALLTPTVSISGTICPDVPSFQEIGISGVLIAGIITTVTPRSDNLF